MAIRRRPCHRRTKVYPERRWRRWNERRNQPTLWFLHPTALPTLYLMLPVSWFLVSCTPSFKYAWSWIDQRQRSRRREQWPRRQESTRTRDQGRSLTWPWSWLRGHQRSKLTASSSVEDSENSSGRSVNSGRQQQSCWMASTSIRFLRVNAVARESNEVSDLSEFKFQQSN